MNDAVPEFTEQELDIVRAILVERYGHAVEVELADSEMLLDSNTDIFTTCPTAYWSHEGCHFVDDILEATATVLKLQAEHALNRRWTFN